MYHRVCIDELAERGASSDSLKIIASFLCGRKMAMKVGSITSTPRAIRGGSPQGTRLGNYLFTIATEGIEEMNGSIARRIPPRICERLADDERSVSEDGEGRPRRFVSTPIERFQSGDFSMKSTPIKGSTSDGVLRYLDTSGRNESDLALEPEQPPARDRRIKTWYIKYVDDLTVTPICTDRNLHFLDSEGSTRNPRR